MFEQFISYVLYYISYPFSTFCSFVSPLNQNVEIEKFWALLVRLRKVIDLGSLQFEFPQGYDLHILDTNIFNKVH